MQQARSFGAFCQTIAAEEYRGKRIRFSAALKANNMTDGWGGLWLRIDGARLDETRAIDTMEDRPLWARPAVSPGRHAASYSVTGPRGADSSSQAPSGDQLTAHPTSPPSMTAPVTASSRRAATSITPTLAGVTAPAASTPPNTTAR